MNGPMALIGKKNPILTEISKPIILNDLTRPALKRLSERMLTTCRLKGGIAIAAPQVGSAQRLIVTWDGRVIVNPEIELDEGEMAEEIEGCLSIPGRLYKVRRPTACALSWIDLDGNDGWANLEGLDARMFQHEVDHLDGILISERGTETANGGFGAMKF